MVQTLTKSKNSHREPQIPFSRTSLVGNELAYIRDSIDRGHISGDGVYTRKCEALFSCEMMGARVLLTTSCTHALEMSAMLLGTAPGDEVILPSFTFPSTANAFALRGARIVFIDVRPDTLNLDERLLPALLNSHVKAVVAMHYGGVACEMDAILAMARQTGVAVVEDNAHGLFGLYRGRPLGTFGTISTLSFHETKNVSCGEGGALVLNDISMGTRAEILREKGTDRSRFFRGEVDNYTWLELGSSYVPSDMLAAFLLAQLEQRTQIQSARERLWMHYRDALVDWAAARGIQLPHVPPHCASPHHLFHLVMPSSNDRRALLAHLRNRGVHAVFHFLPLHLSVMGQYFGAQRGDCPVAESVSERVIRLPLFVSMTASEQMRVIEAVCTF